MPDLPANKASIDKLEAPANAQVDFRDSGPNRVPGLMLRISPTGTKSWVLATRRPGSKFSSRVTLGRYGSDCTLTDARRLAQKFKQELREGNDPVSQRRARAEAAAAEAAKQPLTVAIVSERFVAHCHKINRTASEQERMFKVDILPKWGKRPLGEIRRSDILTLIDTKAETSPFMANRLLALVRRFFNWAISKDLIDTNPAAGLAAPASERSRDRVLSSSELERVWKAAKTMSWPFGPIAQLLILTAQRRDEVVSMRWSEIDLEEGVWTLPADRTKNGVPQRLPLPSLAKELLMALPRIEGTDFVFPSSRNPSAKPVSGLSKAKARLDAEAGVSDWRFHDLRRTAASGMAQLGIAPHVIEKLLNHVTGQLGGVAGIYNRFGYDSEKGKALEAWANHLSRLAVRENELIS